MNMFQFCSATRYDLHQKFHVTIGYSEIHIQTVFCFVVDYCNNVIN